MNKTCAALTACLVLVACARVPAPSRTEAPEAAEEAQLTLIAFGDSLTAGKDLTDPAREAYPALLERRLRESGYAVDVVNAGYSGNTTYDALDRIDFSIPAGADIVLVAFGVNDTFQRKTLEEIEHNLREIVRRIKSKGARVLLAEMKTFPNFGPFYAGKFSIIYRRVADDEDATFIPFFLDGVASNPALNLPDGIHPNAQGHERIADNLQPFIESAVGMKLKPSNTAGP